MLLSVISINTYGLYHLVQYFVRDIFCSDEIHKMYYEYLEIGFIYLFFILFYFILFLFNFLSFFIFFFTLCTRRTLVLFCVDTLKKKKKKISRNLKENVGIRNDSLNTTTRSRLANRMMLWFLIIPMGCMTDKIKPEIPVYMHEIDSS